jgi:two-component system, LytTR family, response regulator
LTLRVLIVDDEPLARDGVALCLESHADVTIVAACENGSEAIRAIREHSPDLVFLDVKMPGLTGFDVIESIGVERMPPVIFLTAYEEHALRAFRVAAIDYLLKPIDAGRLGKALERARTSIAQRQLLKRSQELSSVLDSVVKRAGSIAPDREDRIAVRSGGNIHFLPPQEITWVEAAGDYVTIHTSAQQYVVREAMREMEQRLSPHRFQRVHRGHLVSLSKIRELEINESGDSEIVLDTGTRLKVGRAYKDALFHALKARG